MNKAKKLLLCIFLLLSLAACEKKAGTAPLDQGEYYIYYLNTSETALAPVVYEAEADTEDKEALVEELMDQFIHIPKDVEAGLALDDRVTYKGYTVEDNILYLHFDANYNAMEPSKEILCRAALTKTMTQIRGLDFIGIVSGEERISDGSGSYIGLFSESDFIDGISDINSFEEIELKLYFSNEEGKLLDEEKREVIYHINTPLEKLVVEQLMAGPQAEGLKRTIPQETKLLSISVNDNICYVNFDEGFLKPIVGEEPYISIFSLVNSLCELPGINRVQIAVNGSQDMKFRDSLSLNTLFEMDLDFLRVSQTE